MEKNKFTCSKCGETFDAEVIEDDFLRELLSDNDSVCDDCFNETKDGKKVWEYGADKIVH